MTGLSTHQVSKLLNFFVTTLPRSIPRRSTIRWAKSGCEVPENTLMFGILEWIKFRQPACFSKLSRIKLLARIGLAERTTGITQSTSRSFYYKFFSPKRGQRRRRLIGVCSRERRFALLESAPLRIALFRPLSLSLAESHPNLNRRPCDFLRGISPGNRKAIDVDFGLLERYTFSEFK